MSARHVDAALSEFGIVSVGERHDEIVCLRRFCRVFNLFLRCVFVAPSKVFSDSAAEKHVLLQNHCNAVSEFVEFVLFDVDSAHFDFAVENVVKPWNELHERGLCRTRSADDSYRFAALDVQIDVFEIEHVVRLRVREINVVEVYAAVRDFERIACVFTVFDVDFFIEHFDYTVKGRTGKHDIHKAHSDHHERHKNLHDITQKRRKIAQKHFADYDVVAAEPRNAKYARVNDDLHERERHNDDFFRRKLQLLHGGRHFFELVDLVVFSHKRLHRADAYKVFLRGLVHIVVFAKHLFKAREHDFDADENADYKHGKRDCENHGKVRAYRYRHAHCENEHYRRTHKHTNDDLKRHLYVGHVGCKSCDKACGVETVKVCKTEIFNLVEKLSAKIFRKAR